MLFNSDIFLLVFLPLTLVISLWLERARGRTAMTGALVVASLVFYGWWDWRYLPLLLGSIGVNYLIVTRLHRLPRMSLMQLGVGFNLVLLGLFKYADFALGSINRLSGAEFALLHIVLPLGISFFTFEQIIMLVDTKRGDDRPRGLLSYLFFVVFFPHLIAGPIIKHRHLADHIVPARDKERFWEDLSIGATLFTMGLAKKVLVADRFADFASAGFAAAAAGQPLDMATAWTAALSYTLQLYFDFSGYSDMAIGLARLFGFHLPVNFNSPYKAVSIADFWRRWHITLSQFLRDYLYIPLGGNRKGLPRQLANLLLVMALGGLWHGAGITFLLWGVLHGIALAIHRLWRRFGVHLPALLSWSLTLCFVVTTWVVFRSTDPAAAHAHISAMTGYGVAFGHIDWHIWWGICTGIAGVLLLPNSAQLLYHHLMPERLQTAGITPLLDERRLLAWRPSSFHAVICGLLMAVLVSNLWRSSEFIYFQF